MEWKTLLNTQRLGLPANPDSIRSEFERDADRVIYSNSFRRLGRKTQVHPLAANDHVHTRLTHSLETSHVGKTLGKGLHQRLKKRNEIPSEVQATDLGSTVQAACLAHDIGNPPFGHAGEAAMSHWFRENTQRLAALEDVEKEDLSNYEGNAQGFRVLTQLENHLFSGGLRLTYATLGTFLKYPYTKQKDKDKFSVYISEADILDEVAERLGLAETDFGYSRHPLAYLVEAADDICYSILDLEDGVELRLLRFEEVEQLLLSQFEPHVAGKIRAEFEDSKMFRVNLARMRGPVFHSLVEAALDGFMKAHDSIMEGTHGLADVFDALEDDDPRKSVVKQAKSLAKNHVYTDARKVEIELGAYATLASLLDPLMEGSHEHAVALREDKEDSLGWKSRLVRRLLGDHAPSRGNSPNGDGWTHYQCYRRAVDFVGGMTDNYAAYMAKQIQGMGFTGTQP